MVKSLSSNVLKKDPLVSLELYVPVDVTPDIEDKGDLSYGADVDERALSKIEEVAYNRGFQAGEKAGREEGLAAACKEASSIIKAASCLTEKLEKLRQGIMEKNEEEILRLSLAIARSVIHSEPLTNREVVLSVARSAIKKLSEKDYIKIRLNPEDAEFISARKTELLDSIDGVKEMAIDEDASIAQGGCIVEAGFAEVDARLDQQLDEIMRGLLKGIEGHD